MTENEIEQVKEIITLNMLYIDKQLSKIDKHLERINGTVADTVADIAKVNIHSRNSRALILSLWALVGVVATALLYLMLNHIA